MLGLYSPEEILKIPSHPHVTLTHTHLCTPAHTHAYIFTCTHTCPHTYENLYKPSHTMHTPTHTRTYPRIPVHTCTHLHTPIHTRTHTTCAHKHTHALNLINHMKLHVNRPNTKKTRKEEEDRKKKEQESAEAINGLKKLYTHFQFLLTILVTVVIRQVFSLCLPLVLWNWNFRKPKITIK